MQTEDLIAIDEFCSIHKIETSFIISLNQSGLIDVITVKETGFIDPGQLDRLEKFIHFYYEMDINVEGIETIMHLLQRITNMKDEIIDLKNRLRLCELID